MYDEGFDVEPKVYKEKLSSLEKLFEPIKNRVREHEERPEALKARLLFFLYLGLGFLLYVGLILLNRNWRLYLLKGRTLLGEGKERCIDFYRRRFSRGQSLNSSSNFNTNSSSSQSKRLSYNEIARRRRKVFWQTQNNDG